jgi:hypothetical protein
MATPKVFWNPKSCLKIEFQIIIDKLMGFALYFVSKPLRFIAFLPKRRQRFSQSSQRKIPVVRFQTACKMEQTVLRQSISSNVFRHVTNFRGIKSQGVLPKTAADS